MVLVNTTYLIGCCDLMLIQPWIKSMYCSSLWLTLHIRAGINISHLSIPGIVAHDRCCISHCFVLCVFVFFNCLLCSACILQMHDKPNQFLIEIKVYFFIIIYSFIFYFFFLLIKQLFSHETVKVSRLFCLFWAEIVG